MPKRIPQLDAVSWLFVRTRTNPQETRNTVSQVLSKYFAYCVNTLRKPHSLGAWVCLTAGSVAGCASFDSKYEKVEVPGGRAPAVTARGSTASRATAGAAATALAAKAGAGKAAVGRANTKDDVFGTRTTSRTARRPLTTSTASPRTPSAKRSEIEQVAYFQNEADKKDKGLNVPDVGTDPAKVPADPAAVPNGIPANTAIEIESPAGAQGLTLDQAINFCLIADPVIHAGLEEINQSDADALTASLKPNPQFFTDAQLLPLTRPFTVTKQGGPPQFDAIVAYPIDWFLFGKRAAAMQAAGLGVRVSQSEYEDLIRVRVLEAATAFYGVLEAKSLRDVARQDAENFRSIEALTSAAVDNGGRPLVDLNRIRLDRLRSEQSLRDAENALVAATAQLRTLLGRDDTDPAFDVVGSLETSDLIQPLPVDDAIELADQNRPDLEAARWKIAQADATIELERRKAYPSIIPAFGYTRQYQVRATGFPDADSWLANVTLSVPLFDRNQGNRNKAISESAQAGFQLQARRVALRGEVVRATQDLNTSAANARAVAQDQLQIAKQVRDSINSAYEAGGRPLIDALDAQRNYRETYRLFITSRANYHRAAVKYSATLGRQMGE